MIADQKKQAGFDKDSIASAFTAPVQCVLQRINIADFVLFTPDISWTNRAPVGGTILVWHFFQQNKSALPIKRIIDP